MTQPVDAWFGSWSCDCTDIERTPDEIPDHCPTHGADLLVGYGDQRRQPLNHSGVSGYGIRDAHGERASS